jgi:hypothetical protein
LKQDEAEFTNETDKYKEKLYRIFSFIQSKCIDHQRHLSCWDAYKKFQVKQRSRRHAKMNNRNSSTSTTEEYLSIVKPKSDRLKDRVKTLSVDDF